MFWELLIAITIGVHAGIITGLSPGIHINLISLVVLASTPFLQSYFSLIAIACFIIAMSVTHSFLDSIPGIFLGAPDSDMALGVLPGHRYLLKGEGLTALKLTLIGSFGALILSSLFFPFFLFLVKHGYPLIKQYVGYILLFVALFMIVTDKEKLWAFAVFLLSGTLGYLVLNFRTLDNPLFPLLSGLFGIATMVMSMQRSECLPEQKKINYLRISPKKVSKALLSGQFSGFLTAVLPGVGASMAAVISATFTRGLEEDGFMVLLGSVNTVNFILSMATFYVLDKARNGSIIAVQKLLGETNIQLIILFILVSLIAGAVSVFLTLKLGLVFAKLISVVDYLILARIVILVLFGLTFVLSGALGILILFISTAIGVIPAIVNVKRTHAMGCLMLPAMLFFL